jgi:hypothetical protein
MSMSERERWRILAEEINFDRHDGGIEFERMTDGEYRGDLNAA